MITVFIIEFADCPYPDKRRINLILSTLCMQTLLFLSTLSH